MRSWIAILIVFMMMFSVFSQTIDLNGKVTDTNGNPIKDAIVTLLGKDMADTTGSNGVYFLHMVDITAMSFFTIPQCESISLQRGVIKLSLPEAASMSIEVFDIQGNVIDRVERLQASAGIYYFDILEKTRTPRMMVVRASIGSRFSTFRYLPLQQQLQLVGKKNLAVSSDHHALSKQLADVDSLEVTAAGYKTKVVTISSYEGDIDVMLDKASDLDPFSFFVTSWESLQELAGQKGFGGDLRFGETGPGAGLRGADKICETIAEKSMPGSKVKQWRAFLSVTADENGNQVDARERIGNGPWYDRVGRLLAPTLDDLLNERPQNGDDAIQNDLPNEFGIPNHRPDPEGGDVDNHHTMTGSNEEGKLYSNASYTCQDWTSVAASGPKARCGFAWPRGGMHKVTQMSSGSNWMTGFSSSGCAPGAHLTNSGGGERGIVGSGGGYGGWYCFALNP
jgi:hypothetical protein